MSRVFGLTTACTLNVNYYSRYSQLIEILISSYQVEINVRSSTGDILLWLCNQRDVNERGDSRGPQMKGHRLMASSPVVRLS